MQACQGKPRWDERVGSAALPVSRPAYDLRHRGGMATGKVKQGMETEGWKRKALKLGTYLEWPSGVFLAQGHFKNSFSRQNINR